MATTPTLDIAKFRAAFPRFADETLYPDATIQFAFDLAVMYLGTWSGVFTEDELTVMYSLLTAHILVINGPAGASGGGSSSGGAGALTGATVDKVQVTFAAPTTRSGWQTWLSTSPYGMQLWALLSLRSAGGFFVGGRPERRAFRKVGGRF